MSINVIWWMGQRGSWDHGLLCETFDKYPEVFIQHNETMPPHETGRSIVIVVGKPNPDRLYGYLSTLVDSLVILTSDEDAFFDWRKAIPAQHTIWTQYWNPEYKAEIKERILLGAPNRLKNYKINTHLPKKYLWSFIGQVQNPFRQACVDVLKTLPDGFLHIVPQFGGGDGGIDYQEYLDILCQSKYAICPAGSMSAETFRLYEAMECGAIPVTDMRSPRDNHGFNYWEQVYSWNGVILVDDWKDLTESRLKERLTWSQDYAKERNEWWITYKQQLEQKLLNYATDKN